MTKIYLYFVAAEEFCVCVSNFTVLRQVLKAYECGMLGTATTLKGVHVGEKEQT